MNFWLSARLFKGAHPQNRPPGGVGPMTIAMLLKNTVMAAKLQNALLMGK